MAAIGRREEIAAWEVMLGGVCIAPSADSMGAPLGSVMDLLPAVRKLCELRNDIRVSFENSDVGSRFSAVATARAALTNNHDTGMHCEKRMVLENTTLGALCEEHMSHLDYNHLQSILVRLVDIDESAAALGDLVYMERTHRGSLDELRSTDRWKAVCVQSTAARFLRLLLVGSVEHGARQQEAGGSWRRVLLSDFTVGALSADQQRSGSCDLCFCAGVDRVILFETSGDLLACKSCMATVIGWHAIRNIRRQLQRCTHADARRAAIVSVRRVKDIWSKLVDTGDSSSGEYRGLTLGEIVTHRDAVDAIVPLDCPQFALGMIRPSADMAEPDEPEIVMEDIIEFIDDEKESEDEDDIFEDDDDDEDPFLNMCVDTQEDDIEDFWFETDATACAFEEDPIETDTSRNAGQKRPCPSQSAGEKRRRLCEAE